MSGIWQYPDLEELEQFILNVVSQAKEELAQQNIVESTFIPDAFPQRILIIGEWGEGTAEFGEDQLRVVVAFGFAGPSDTAEDIFELVNDQMVDVLSDRRVEVPPDAQQAFGGVEFIPVNNEKINNVLNQMSRSDLELIFDLTSKEAVDLVEARPPDEFPRTPADELIETDEDEIEEDEEEVDELQEEADVDDEPPTIPDSLLPITEPTPDIQLIESKQVEEEIEFEDVPPELRPFAKSDSLLEIPAGKETKEIDVREPFNFEIEMAQPGVQTSSDVFQQTIEGIGRAAGGGPVGASAAAGSFPRTGFYIRNYLKFRGPAYSYEIYKNLVFYSAYISSIHNINVKPGTYQSFRDYIFVLQKINEEGGPMLIEALSQPQAASQGLETIPDHPSIEGEKAPWLERRQYYRLIEDNDNHPAWENAYDYLHGED